MKTSDSCKIQAFILQGMPQIGPVLAKRLMQHFKSVANVMNASVDDLAKVEGIGNISAERIRMVLDTEIKLHRDYT